MMTGPVIGVVPLVDDERESLWMLPGYMDGITRAGGIPVMLPLTAEEQTLRQLARMCGGFLLTGGHDVSPALYGEAPIDKSVVCCPARDDMERKLLRLGLEEDIPVLGICRGIQLINVFFGGTLYQDLPAQHPSGTEHHQPPPYDVPAHSVTLVQGSPLHALLGQERLQVNSYHHQAVRDLAPPLQAMAYSEDGLVEAAYHPDMNFLWAVQWHPEFAAPEDPCSRRIFGAFVERAAGRHT